MSSTEIRQERRVMRDVWERTPYYIRQMKINGQWIDRWRLLIPVPGGSCKNREYPAHFGCYPSIRAAELVRDEAIRRLARPGVSIWQVLVDMRQEGILAVHLMPRWVYQRLDGGFGARSRVRGRSICLPGPYADELTACRAMRAEFERRRLMKRSRALV